MGLSRPVRHEHLWRHTHGNKAAKELGNRWVLMPKIDDHLRGLSLAGFAKMFRPDGTPLIFAGSKQVNGRPAVVLRNKSGDSLCVAADGRPVPLKVGEPDGRNWLNFTDHDAPLDISEPTDFVDPEQPPSET